MKRFITAVLAFVIILMSAPFGAAGASYAAETTLQGYEAVAASGALVLYADPDGYKIALEDRRNGYIWRSSPDPSVYDTENASAVWNNYMASFFTFTYAILDSNNCVPAKNCPAKEESKVKVEKINNGILLDYDFTKIGLDFAFEIKLDGDSLVIRLPADRIRESGKYGLVSVEILPFLGAADKRTDGYIMYPDGCGALLDYGNADNRPAAVNMCTWFVYGPEDVNSAEYVEMDKNRKYQAMLPVFGVKNNNNAFLAIASEGEADAKINLSPEGYVVDLNRVSFEFTYRHFFKVELSNIIINGQSMAKEPTGIKADRNLTRQDHEARYIFLEGNEADYSGMADSYREYLTRNNELKSVIKAGDSIPMALDLFMGIKEKRLIFDKYITMTSFDQAISITQKFLENGVKNMQVTLNGWTSGGYGNYPVSWPPDRKLGGVKGLQRYSEFADANKIDLFLKTNFTVALGENGGFSKRNDVVLGGDGLPVTDDARNWFLFNPMEALQRLKSFLTQVVKYGITGLAAEKLGEIVYHDYNKNNPATRDGTQQSWEDALAAAEKNGPVAVEGANSYVLKYADRLFNIPVQTSEYNIDDETIPFLQMVLHGMIPYTSDPGNLFYDKAVQKLKWVEYGCLPYYELTYQKAQNLRYTTYNRLFSSYYADWIDDATAVYKEFNARLGPVWGEKMIKHEKVGEDLFRTQYGNGTTVYVNYADVGVKCDGYEIKPMDYLVVEKGGVIK